MRELARLSDLTDGARRTCLEFSEALAALAALARGLEELPHDPEDWPGCVPARHLADVEAGVRIAWLVSRTMHHRYPQERLERALLSGLERIQSVLLDVDYMEAGASRGARRRRAAARVAGTAAVKALCAVVDYWRAAEAAGEDDDPQGQEERSEP
jgi:hypothetical protein